jgi:hypothetical protein
VTVAHPCFTRVSGRFALIRRAWLALRAFKARGAPECQPRKSSVPAAVPPIGARFSSHSRCRRVCHRAASARLKSGRRNTAASRTRGSIAPIAAAPPVRPPITAASAPFTGAPIAATSPTVGRPILRVGAIMPVVGATIMRQRTPARTGVLREHAPIRPVRARRLPPDAGERSRPFWRMVRRRGRSRRSSVVTRLGRGGRARYARLLVGRRTRRRRRWHGW